jgi:hypothetical protein
MGPVPLRTARGAGRVELDRPFAADVLRDRLPDDRVFEELERVLLLDDAGGEDVRVAMVTNLGDRHTCHMLHTPEDATENRPGRRNPRPRGDGEARVRS